MPLKSAGILLFNSNSVLLQLRDNTPNIASPNTWSFPGGGFKAKENSKQCIVREIVEECDYLLNTERMYKMLTLKNVTKGKIRTLFVYISEYDRLQTIKCQEGQKMEFVEISRVEAIPNMSIYTKLIISEGYKIYNILKDKKYFL